MQLLSSIALPILTYGSEALLLNKTQLMEIDHPWQRSCMKIFYTYDANIVKQCQWFAGVMPIMHYYTTRCMSFWCKLECCSNALTRSIYLTHQSKDISTAAERYNCPHDLFAREYKQVILKSFSKEIL